jgi:hypothetical protein
MAFVGLGVSTNYNNVRVEDVINDKTKIDSNLDVLGATYSLAQMELIRSDLGGQITALQEQIDQQAVLIQELQAFVVALQSEP